MIRDRINTLERVRAGSLVPHPSNFRTHPKNQRSALEGILQEVGWAEPLVCYRDGSDLVLIDGHLRASLDPEVLVPVAILDVDPVEAKMLLASLDPIAALAGANEQALADLLASVMPATESLADLFETLRPRSLPGDLDEAPPPPTKPKTKTGQLFALGRHRLLCGDARSASDLARLLEQPADAMITDPPYGVEYFSKSPARLRIRNDSEKGLAELLAQSFALASTSLVDGAPVYCFSPAGPMQLTFLEAFAEAFRLRQSLAWDKGSPVMGHSDYPYAHEVIHFGYAGSKAKGRGRAGWYGGHTESSVLRFASPNRNDLHATMKPIALLSRLIENSTRKDQMILDPFAGGGSLMVACEELGRSAAMMEIDPAYCDVIRARFTKHR